MENRLLLKIKIYLMSLFCFVLGAGCYF